MPVKSADDELAITEEWLRGLGGFNKTYYVQVYSDGRVWINDRSKTMATRGDLLRLLAALGIPTEVKHGE